MSEQALMDWSILIGWLALAAVLVIASHRVVPGRRTSQPAASRHLARHARKADR